ncbi:nickel pincer cofactor biosynthesis protein LarC [Catellatospora sp. NPDC049609]|uniref:nickel pincer cofactor biosynthesis protein LarC n=1 Tax=Catellatospora sp. NPDC049609 TaxID=3155505 RepID=UPI0034152D7C
MRTLWIDPGQGCAGDMLLAALLDAGASLDVVRAGLAGLRVEPVTVDPVQVRRHGLRATYAQVQAPETETERHLSDVLAVIGKAGLPHEAAAFATAAFQRLAEAEARVHGVGIERIHFHEVGALDAIADVVGCALALHDLDLLGDGVTRVVGPIALGSGTVRAAHGLIPVPVPAVLELVTAAGAPVAEHPGRMELCTPTGAALLAALATAWGPPPAGTPVAVGVGAGTRDPETHPNVVRVVIGTATAAAGAGDGWLDAELHRVDATVDDLDPRVWPTLLDHLRGVGAADAWCTAALGHKGRPAHVLSVLTDAERLDTVCRVVFEHTTTLGVRVSRVERRSLRRDRVRVRVGAAEVGVKRGFLDGRVVTAQPEYDEVVAAAQLNGVPVTHVLAALQGLATVRGIDGLDQALRPE